MQRKLTAILSADVVGYSGLMEADEAGTLARLKLNRSTVFDPHVAAHGGRIFKLIGDGALAEFPSVVEAVNCALAIQDAMARTEPDQAEEKRIRYRIGINLGDIIIDGDDVYGDGVNVAARLQALAPVGGIALSGIVRDQVEGKTACLFEDMGEHRLKNIDRPVRAFSVQSGANQTTGRRPEASRAHSICVLPFANMSGDVEQEYFSDGISEDIITDLSKVSALSVVARNTSFQFKGKSVDVAHVARQLKVSHVLEGSVRKSGGRVRITAQLIDGAAGDHVWAERYDRDLNDIFALQDEISEAIVNALRLKLLPEEKRAIERRGTDSVEAYNLYLMARQYFTTGNFGDTRRHEAIIRLCSRATDIDPDYANAWALMASAQVEKRWRTGAEGDGGVAAAERALALNADLADAHAIKARILFENGQVNEADREIATALRLNPEAWEVNSQAATLCMRQRRLLDAAGYYEKAATLLETDFSSPGMLITTYTGLRDLVAARRSAQMVLARVEKVIAEDRSNGAAMSFGVNALIVLGQYERAKEWINRGLLVDPDNLNMRYNFACAVVAQLKDADAALDLLGPFFERAARGILNYALIDPDLESLRDHPRFKAMFAAADSRLKAEEVAAKSPKA